VDRTTVIGSVPAFSSIEAVKFNDLFNSGVPSLWRM
jgi:hypothetical protein